MQGEIDLLLFQEKNKICDVLNQISEDLSKLFFDPSPAFHNSQEFSGSDILQHVLDYTREILEAEKCALFLVDIDESILLLERVSGTVDFEKLKDVATYDLRDINKLGSGVTPWVLHRRKPFNARTFDELRHNSEGHWKGNWDVPMYGGQDYAKEKFQCVYMVPLIAGKKAIGVLKYENRIGDKKYFNESDERIIDVIASLLTNLVISQRIERNRYDVILPSISTTIVSHLDKPTFYEKLLEQCRVILSADLCSLFLVNDQESLYLKCIVGVDKNKKSKLRGFEYHNYRISDGLTPWILNRKTSFNVRSYPDLLGRSENHHVGKWDKIVYDGKPMELFKSLYSVPLIIGDERIGVFKVENKNIPPYYFTESDERLFDLIGRLIAVAVKYEKARANEEYVSNMMRAAELGFLAAGISHEFNSYLQRILATSISALDLVKNYSLKGKLNQIIEEVDKASKLIENLKKTTNRPAFVSDFSIDDIIKQIISISEERFFNYDVKLEYECEYDGKVKLNQSEVQTILINLLNNAFEASVESVQNKLVKIIVRCSNNEIIIDVADSGAGISSGEKEMLFTPFYTRKESGMGMGLFLVQRLINTMKGRIQVFSPNEIGGATFRVRIPSIATIGE